MDCRRRKRDCTALISDCTNILEAASKRNCAVIAKENIKKSSQRKLPRGVNQCDHHSTPATRNCRPTASASARAKCTLSQILKDRPEILEHGQQIIHTYIERNSALVVQKAVALNIFSISVFLMGAVSWTLAVSLQSLLGSVNR